MKPYRLRDVLALPQLYRLFMHLTGNMRARRMLAEEWIKATPGDRVLDIGCGTGELRSYLPAVAYEGFDMNPRYIRAAAARFGDRGRFVCQRVSEAAIAQAPGYDVVTASGILHHLEDGEALELFRLAGSALKPGGRLLTLDGCYVAGQSRIARFLLSHDRGKHVRDEAGYRMLASQAFAGIRTRLYHDLLYVPYSLIVIECVAPAGESHRSQDRG